MTDHGRFTFKRKSRNTASIKFKIVSTSLRRGKVKQVTSSRRTLSLSPTASLGLSLVISILIISASQSCWQSTHDALKGLWLRIVHTRLIMIDKPYSRYRARYSVLGAAFVTFPSDKNLSVVTPSGNVQRIQRSILKILMRWSIALPLSGCILFTSNPHSIGIKIHLIWAEEYGR